MWKAEAMQNLARKPASSGQGNNFERVLYGLGRKSDGQRFSQS